MFIIVACSNTRNKPRDGLHLKVYPFPRISILQLVFLVPFLKL